MNPTGGNNTTLSETGGRTLKPLGYQVAEYIIIILGFCANSFICFAFSYYRRIRTVNNYFVLNLAITDMLLIFLLGLWIAVPSILKTLTDEQGSKFVLFITTFETFCSSASIATLTVLSYDRFSSVTKPLHYTANITGRKAVVFIVFIWLYATVMALLGLTTELPTQKFYDYGYLPLLVLCNVMIPLAITLYCYITIFVIASRHLRHNPHGRNQDVSSPANVLAKNLKIAMHILVLVAPLSLCWSTYYTISVIDNYCYDCIFCCISTLQDWIISNMTHILGTVDPIIYILLTKDLRKIIFGWFACHNRRLFVSETFHLSATRATTSQGSPSSPTGRRLVEM